MKTNADTRKRLEAAGWKATSVQDFLNLDAADMEYIEGWLAMRSSKSEGWLAMRSPVFGAKHGGRYRTRTCDFHHVKVTL